MSIDRGVDKEHVVHIYNGILLSHKNEWNNVTAATWMDVEIVILREVSQTQKDKYHMIYVESKKWYKWIYSQNRNSVTDVENKLMVTKGERAGEGGINCDIEIDVYALLYIK